MSKLFLKTAILILLFICSISGFAQNLPEIPKMEAHFPLDGGKGNLISEMIGGVNGTLQGIENNDELEAAWISSKLDGALHLDGKNDRIFVPHNAALDFADEDFSVSFYMKWKKGVVPHSQHIFCKGDYHSAAPDQTGKRWEMFMSSRGVSFIVDDDENKSEIQAQLDDFITGEWIHVVALRDTKADQLRLYVNGRLQRSTNPGKAAINGTDITGSIANPQRLTIGDAYLCDNPFPGDLDDFRIFRTVLSEKQISELASLVVEVKPVVKQDLSNIHLVPDFAERPRIIVTSDGEIDDQCSMIRFMLYTNENDIEGIITSSSQYHWRGHKWAGDDWIDPDLDAYEKVYPNLIKHDPNYPTPEYLRSITFLGNVDDEGEMEKITEGSQHIVKVLLDESNHNPIWLQAWGGTNTIARALKTIEEEHPEKMAYVAKKCRFFFIWEQDVTYQEYIRPHWGKYNIPTIISDQFEAIAYRWKQAQPEEMHPYFEGKWMKENILENHGPLCSIYAAHDDSKGSKSKGFAVGDFRSEGDSPAFLHTIITGLRNRENPAWGGWGGRYVRVRENTYLDPVPVKSYAYPSGRWSGATGWGRGSLRPTTTSTQEQRMEYFKPMWRWTDVLQNDFASRADWCVMSYEEANHPPVVVLANELDLQVVPGETVNLSAEGTSDPDKDKLTYSWWQHVEADTYEGTIQIKGANKKLASFVVPNDAKSGKTIHVVCEVSDNGSPQLTRYRRVVIEVKNTTLSHKFDTAVGIPPMSAHITFDDINDNVIVEKIHGLKGKFMNGDPQVASIEGAIGGAIQLDGVDDYVLFPNNGAYDFGKESFSITFWMRWPKDLPTSHERLMTKGDYEASIPGEMGIRYEIYIGAGNLRFNMDDDKAKSQIQVSAEPFITGEWVHVAAVRDLENNRMKLYANGVLQPTSKPGDIYNDGLDRTGSIKNACDLFIGEATRLDAPFQGDLDDIRFFRDALTDEQVAAIAANAELFEVKPVAVEVKEKPRVIHHRAKFSAITKIPPMEAYWPLDEKKGDVVTDEVNGLKGKLTDADPSNAWINAPIGDALRLDGIDDRVFIPNNPAFDFAGESFSISFMMRWPKGVVAHHEHMIAKGDYASSAPGETGKRWEIIMASGKGLCFNIDDDVNKSQILVPFDAYTTGEWVHVVAIRDTKKKELRLYADGVLQNAMKPDDPRYDGVDRTGNISNPQQLIFGDSKRLDNPFEGDLADVRIFRTVLTGPQISKIWAMDSKADVIPSMDAHWPMDEKSGTKVTEMIGGLNGTLTNADPASVWTTGKLGGALQLDGQDDHIVVPNNPAVDFSDEAFSVSFFIRWPQDKISGHQHFINKGDYKSSNPGETGKRWEITTVKGVGVSFIVDDDINKSAIVVPFDAFATGEWVHVAAVRDVKHKLLRLYADGVPQRSIAKNDPLMDGIDRTGSISNPRDLHIGYSGYNDNPFKGDLDDVKIFRTALNELQIAKIATNGKPIEIPPMEAYWPLDNKSGNIVTERISGLNGTLNNGDSKTAWVSGAKDGALMFDGLDDRVIVPHNSAFDFADESFSVSFLMRWPKEVVPHHEHMLTKGDYTSAAPNETGKRWEICMDSGKGICFTIDDDVNKSNILVPFDAFTTGEWVHVVAIRDTKNKVLKLYADGVLQEAVLPDNPKFDGIDRTASIANPQNLFIGDASRLDNPFVGELDDIRIFRSVLTETQIDAIVK